MYSIQQRTHTAGISAPALTQAQAAAPFQSRPRAAEPGLRYPFTLPPLPYAADANEPVVDAATMQLHHDKHQAAYVDNLNAALATHPALQAMPLHDLLANLSGVPDPVHATVRNKVPSMQHVLLATLIAHDVRALAAHLAKVADYRSQHHAGAVSW